MNCKDEKPKLKGLPLHEINRFLKKERNNAFLSRQDWIQAAFDLKYKKDDTLFNHLVESELCKSCVEQYKI